MKLRAGGLRAGTARCWLQFLLAVACAFTFTACASSRKRDHAPPVPAQAGSGKNEVPRTASARAGAGDSDEADDDLDEYDVVEISDPLEPVNRVTFSFNHYLYKGVLRPLSKGYEFVVPSLLRKGIHNAYENVRFPVRFVNHALQGKFDRAGREFEKFLVNSVLGVGGLMKPSEKFPALAEVPRADTGQTFSKWGVDHGFYFVIPVLGPSSARDTVGLVGDGALNPVSWVAFAFGGSAWTLAVTSPDTVRSWPDQMDQYDTVTKEAVDRYLAARSSYVQHRKALKER